MQEMTEMKKAEERQGIIEPCDIALELVDPGVVMLKGAVTTDDHGWLNFSSFGNLCPHEQRIKNSSDETIGPSQGAIS